MKALLKSLIADTNPIRLLYHKIKAMAATIRFGSPAKKLRVIGVTGTDGKTTTVAMISHILHANGKNVGAVSSAFLEVNGVRTSNPTQKTSLPPFALQKFLRKLVNEQCEFAVIEASSHGLVQGRLTGIKPEVAAITNTSMEHLDYHGTMKAYLEAKSRLFKALKGTGTKVLNRDDESYDVLSNIRSNVTVTFGEKASDMTLIEMHSEDGKNRGVIQFQNKRYDIELPIPGSFNLLNAMTALLSTISVGIPVDAGIKALQTFNGAPGRMEAIDEGQNFRIFVDFTVTPVAYEKTLTSLRKMLRNNGRLLVLTGSCGDRMQEKRPIVGKICSELADVVVVTNEDPYTEDPEKIINEVFAGISEEMPSIDAKSFNPSAHHAFAARISDRLEAIKFLLKHAKQDDIILFAGKGGDVTMMTRHGQIPWDESAIVRTELRNI